jgi:hypothetical protein
VKRLFVAMLCLGGCARQAPLRPLDAAALARSSPRTVIVAVSNPPIFDVSWNGNPAFSLAVNALLFVQHEGTANGLRASGFGDPAATARPFLVTALARRFAVREMNRGTFATVAEEPAAIARDYPGADLIVDVRTLKWGLITRRDDRLWLQYVGRFRLIDGRSGSVLAEGTCANPEPRGDSEQPPVYLEWTFDGGAKLKQELWATANRCVGEYLTRVLGI